MPSDWEYVHYTSRAVGGIGLIITGMTAISPTGRITPKCTGLWNDEQMTAWSKIVDFIHQYTKTKIGIQLGHSGRKGAVTAGNLAKPLVQDGWALISASAISYKDDFAIPKEIDEHDMEMVKNQFVASAIRAEKAGFDVIELQLHNGFLLASFLSPLTNHRKDAYGGSIENRAKYPLEVVKAVKAATKIPIVVKLSVEDWLPNGISKSDVIYICENLKNMGVSMLDIVTGNTAVGQKPATGRMWQTPFSEWIRNTVNIPTITSGSIETIDQINTILLNHRADLVALGRPLLANPYFVLHAKAYEQFQAQNLASSDFPASYMVGIQAEYSKAKKDRSEYENMKKALKPISHEKK